MIKNNIQNNKKISGTNFWKYKDINILRDLLNIFFCALTKKYAKEWTRTTNQKIFSLLLCQLSYPSVLLWKIITYRGTRTPTLNNVRT